MSREPLGFDAVSHEKHHWWRSLLFKLVVCGAATALLWWASGWAGLLVALMLWGRAFASDLFALGETLGRHLKALAFRPVQGRFYAFKGHRIRVLDDELLPQRWIALEDLATALGAPLPAAVLRRRQPEALRELRDGSYALDEFVMAWLRDQRNDRAVRLAHWVEREVWFPARGRKASYAQKKGASEDAPSGGD
ncbi:hypothetical protein ACS5PN_01370 [Roseateles sp. NT4]|uniref:hypothetical protein n=1 Tax=Roseateles sp. NT4 TaxID=3453715 RepID=UPI003EEA8B92